MLTFLSFGRYDFLEETSSNHPWKTDLEQSLPYVFDSFLLVSVSPLLLFSKQCSLQLYNTKNLHNSRFCNTFYLTFNSKKSEFFQFLCFFLNPSDFFQFEFICSYFWDMRNLQEQVEKELYYQKLFWPFTVWTNCSSDLKTFVNSRPSASNFKSFSRSL